MLILKMIRDIRTNKVQFIAIFLMTFLGVFLYSGLTSDHHGLEVYSQKFYKKSNLGDVWVHGKNFSQDDIKKLKQDDSIKMVERRAVIQCDVPSNQKQKVELNILKDNQISKIHLVKGKPFKAKQDGIWIDQTFASENHLNIGDMYTLKSDQILIKKTIVGMIYHPEYVYQNASGSLMPNHKNNGYAFISSSFSPPNTTIPFTQLIIKTSKPQRMQKIVSDSLSISNLTFILKADLPSYSTLNAEITQHKAFGSIFPAVFLLIAILMCMTTISKLIMNQRLQIGILKALGFKSKKLISHYLSHVITITTLGALSGYFIGPLVIPPLIYPMLKALFILPELNGVPLTNSFITVAFALLGCFLVGYLVIKRQLKAKPIDSLLPPTIVYQKQKKSSRRIMKNLSFYNQWNIRDMIRNKIRSVIAIFGIAGCMGLLICAFGVQNSIDYLMQLMFQDLQTYEMRVNITTPTSYKDLQKKIKGSAIMESTIEIKHNKNKKMASLTVQEDTRYLKLMDKNKKFITLPKQGIALSHNVAKSFDVIENETITWRILGSDQWQKSVIKSIIRTPSTQGITMSKTMYEQSNQQFLPNALLGLKANVKNMKGIASIQYLKTDLEKSMESMLAGTNLMIAMLIIGALTLGVIVLFNINSFSYMEKMRDMATLKVLGFNNKKVKKLLHLQNVYLSLIGILIGIPFGYTLITLVFSSLSETMDILIKVQPSTYIGCVLLTMLMSMFIMAFVCRRIKKIDMVISLKAIE